jgi:integrase
LLKQHYLGRARWSKRTLQRFLAANAEGGAIFAGLLALQTFAPFNATEPVMDQVNVVANSREPWNKGKLVGQKVPLKLKEIWAIRIRLQLAGLTRDLALFNLAIDSKLRACDLVKLRVRDVCHGDRVAARAIVMQQKTRRSVQFEITEATREAIADWMRRASLRSEDHLFPSRLRGSAHLSTRQYARIVARWVRKIGLDPAAYGTHTMRRTKATLIYRRTKNLRAVQLLLGHSKLESTVRYLGIEVDDALEIAE